RSYRRRSRHPSGRASRCRGRPLHRHGSTDRTSSIQLRVLPSLSRHSFDHISTTMLSLIMLGQSPAGVPLGRVATYAPPGQAAEIGAAEPSPRTSLLFSPKRAGWGAGGEARAPPPLPTPWVDRRVTRDPAAHTQAPSSQPREYSL